MFCTNCGTQLPEGSLFCTKCGSRVAMMNEQPAADAEKSIDVQPVQVNTDAQPVTETEEDSKTVAILPDEQQMYQQPVQTDSTVGSPFTQAGQPVNGMNNPFMQGNSGYGQMQGIAYTSSPENMAQYMQMPPKKRFIMPMAVNIIFGLLAVIAVAACVAVFILGKPEKSELQQNENQATVTAENPKSSQTENLEYDLSGEVMSLEIPETEESQKAAQMAESFIIEDSNSRYLERDELEAYTEDELFYALFEIFARAGLDMYDFGEDIESYFEAKSWYEPSFSIYDVEDLEDFMNEYEIANAELIEDYLINEYGWYDDELEEMEE